MDILFLLIPLSLVLVAAIGIVLFWAVNTGQFEATSKHGQVIIDDNDGPTPQQHSAVKNSSSETPQ
ncbi:MAG TPA: cbb3-type cytochrome oxidase assembly protein CcoS [Limnobacter sp.]|nr:cbb3-type cytochrome oxidase assembly protein CcoS [Limnobacter sp.]